MCVTQFKREVVKSKGWRAVPDDNSGHGVGAVLDDNSEHSGRYHMIRQCVCGVCPGVSFREGHFWFTLTMCRPSLSPYEVIASCLPSSLT